MTEISRPWNGTTTGDCGPYSDQQWHAVWRKVIGFGAGDANDGPIRGNDDGTNDCLFVRANSPAAANVKVSPGSALVRGIGYINDADVTLSIAANASGNARIDTIVLRADFTAQTVRLAVRQGTPAASPVAPTLTQTDGVLWEIPLADVAVANGFTVINQSDISPNAHFANLADGVYLDNVLNNSGGLLETGDVVVWDTTTNRAVTTTTTLNAGNVAGVWVGRTASGSRGRVQVRGIGWVKANAAISTRMTKLVTSTTAKQAAAYTNDGDGNEIGFTLETTSGAGLVLTGINVRRRVQDYILIRDEKAQNTEGGTFTSGAWRTRTLNTEVVDTGNHAALASNQITLEAGTYQVRISCPAINVARHQARLQNITDGTTLLVGTSESSAAASTVTSRSLIEGRITLSAQKVLEVQHQCQTTGTTTGFGLASNFTTEVYTIVELIRES